MAAHHLPSIVTKIVTSYSYVTIHIQWGRRLNLYLLIFSFIQYLFVVYNLSKVIKEILVANVTYN